MLALAGTARPVAAADFRLVGADMFKRQRRKWGRHNPETMINPFGAGKYKTENFLLDLFYFNGLEDFMTFRSS